MAHTKTTLFTLKVEGTSPGELGLRSLAALIDAAAALVQAASPETVPLFTMPRVKKGSAVLLFDSTDPGAVEVARTIGKAVRARGEGASRQMVAAIAKLHGCTRETPVSLVLRPGLIGKGKRWVRVPVAAPREVDRSGPHYDLGTVIYGRLVGVFANGDDTLVRLRPPNERKHVDAVSASSELTKKALLNFGRNVRVSLVQAHDAMELHRLDPWSDEDPVEALVSIGGALKLDANVMLNALRAIR